MSELMSQVAPRGVFAPVVRAGDQAFLGGQVPPVGTKVEFKDGRKFVFVSSIVSHAAGVLKGMAAPSAEIAGSAGAVGAVGATSITLMTSTLAANLYKDGTVHFVDDTGEGYTYKIKSHTAGTTTVGAVFQLYDPLLVAISTDTDFVLVQNPYVNTIENTATTIPIGVTLGTFTYASATGPGYFWVQTHGPCTVLGTGTIGVPLEQAAAGAVVVYTGTTAIPPVGIAIQTSASGHVAAWLNLGTV